MNWIKTIAKSILKEEIDKLDLKIALLNSQNTTNLSLMSKLKLDNDILYDALSKAKTQNYANAITSVSELFDESDLKPTEKDKPSAHSSLSKSEAMIKLKKIFYTSKYQIVTVRNTNSMEPFIDSNSIIVTEKLSESVLNTQPMTIGDICVYEGKIRGVKTLIIHRIQGMNLDKTLYRFKGDNNFKQDPWVEKSQIKYRYIGQIQTRIELVGD